MSLLDIEDVSVDYRIGSGSLRAVDHVSLRVEQGEALGIVGESGCGKTSLGLAVPMLLPANASISSGSISLGGRELVGMSERELNQLRWTEVAFVFQGAMNALNPVQRVDRQILEAITAHDSHADREVAGARVLELLELVGIAAARAKSYPHEFSGGMRQRAMIAMALACRPSLLIADEPTTALDVISQAQILALLDSLRRSEGLSLMMISHDLSAIKRVCDRIVVMYAGVVVESGTTEEVLGRRGRPAAAQHPYTKALIAAHPDLGGARSLAQGLSGHPPDLSVPITGCRFADRCDSAMEICREQAPASLSVSPGHVAACHLARRLVP
ncbi:MAG: ABC transporter ATP-binding protein [Acidimicrobiaceae bacterium]|nr:ABC transporter ATP-binding protein [Acidimicrobiaceae bacterium]